MTKLLDFAKTSSFVHLNTTENLKGAIGVAEFLSSVPSMMYDTQDSIHNLLGITDAIVKLKDANIIFGLLSNDLKTAEYGFMFDKIRAGVSKRFNLNDYIVEKCIYGVPHCGHGEQICMEGDCYSVWVHGFGTMDLCTECFRKVETIYFDEPAYNTYCTDFDPEARNKSNSIYPFSITELLQILNR